MTKAQEKRIQQYLNILKINPFLYQIVNELQQDKKNKWEKVLYQTVFAPVVICFLDWVLESALQKGLERLYFLARDGYPFYIVAKELCDIKGIQIECRYLYGSRYAWRVPQFALEGANCVDKICLGGIDVTFEKIMKRASLTEEEVQIIIKEIGFEKDRKEVLSPYEIEQLKHKLSKSKTFFKFVYEHSKMAYGNTIGYLKQEGLLQEIPYALVDSGWVGSLQKTLTQLLHHEGYQKQIQGFYFGLYELPDGVKKENYHTYYFDTHSGIKKKVNFSNCLFEAIFSAPHGMTVAYEKKDNQYIPIFYKEQNINQVRMEQMTMWLKEFLQKYKEQIKNKDFYFIENRKLVYQLLKTFMGKPKKEEAMLYGNLLFSDDVTEEYTQNVAINFSKEEINNHAIWNKAFIKLGIKRKVIKESAWIEGSVALYDKEKNKWFFHVKCYKALLYLRKWLKRGL